MAYRDLLRRQIRSLAVTNRNYKRREQRAMAQTYLSTPIDNLLLDPHALAGLSAEQLFPHHQNDDPSRSILVGLGKITPSLLSGDPEEEEPEGGFGS